MTLVWVTGVPGAGKSVVAAALRDRGFASYDADEDGFRAWRSTSTGEFFDERQLPASREAVALDLVPGKVRALRAEYMDGLVVLAGHVPNEAECIEFFDEVVALVIDDTTLVSRLNQRSGRSFGKSPDAQQVILQWNAEAPAKYRSMQARTVDATQPIDRVAAAVAAICESLVRGR